MLSAYINFGLSVPLAQTKFALLEMGDELRKELRDGSRHDNLV